MGAMKRMLSPSPSRAGLTLVALFLAGSLAACGAAASPAATAPPPQAATTGSASSAQRMIMVYVAVPAKTLKAEIAAFEKAHPSIHVETYVNGSGPVTSRVEAEQRAGHIGGDVI